MPVKMICPRCRSTDIWKKGLTPTRKGPKVRYMCTKCGTSFYKSTAGKPAGKVKKDKKE
jgi:transposase-like protein